FAALEHLPVELVERTAFPDHHPYAAAEIERLIERAAGLDAIAVTTTKDLVRVPRSLRPRVTAIEVELRWRDPEAIRRLLAATREAPGGRGAGRVAELGRQPRRRIGDLPPLDRQFDLARHPDHVP